MILTVEQITMISNTIKEIVGVGIDTLIKKFMRVETEQPKTRKKRKHREKKNDRKDSI